MAERTTIVDFVARGDSPGEWQMVLVEEGPWSQSTEIDLRRIQDRLYGALDAALEGKLAEQFPESLGKKIVIQLDCYNSPSDEIAAFFERFSKGVLQTTDYKKALIGNPYVSGIDFRSTFESIN